MRRHSLLSAWSVAALLVALSLGLALAAEMTAVVKVDKANVRSGPGTGYPAMTTFSAGTKIRILETSGDWYRVALPREGQGWIYKDMVTLDSSPKAESSGGGLLDSLKRGFTASRQEQMTATAGSRGLGEGEGGSSSMAVNWEAVKRMEALTIPPGEVEAFIREGKLSPEKKP
jgi:N-acetylmuramoyl-L-alanine amidase